MLENPWWEALFYYFKWSLSLNKRASKCEGASWHSNEDVINMLAPAIHISPASLLT